MKDTARHVVVITGATGGLGQALVRRFAEAGFHIAALDLKKAGLQTLQKSLPAASIFIQVCDVTTESSVNRAIAAIIRHWGRIDVLVNNAGISHRSAFANTKPSVIKKVLEVSYLGSVYCTARALPALARTKGSILAISSPAGYGPLVARTGYAGAKHAMHGFFNSLRAEVSPDIHVQLVCPSFTRTGIGSNSLGPDGKPLGVMQKSVGKFLEPDFVAARIFEGWQKKKELLLIGKSARLGYWINKFAPALYRKLMLRSLKSELN